MNNHKKHRERKGQDENFASILCGCPDILPDIKIYNCKQNGCSGASPKVPKRQSEIQIITV
jgi:hypothetical protein